MREIIIGGVKLVGEKKIKIQNSDKLLEDNKNRITNYMQIKNGLPNTTFHNLYFW